MAAQTSIENTNHSVQLQRLGLIALLIFPQQEVKNFRFAQSGIKKGLN
jgi:hypothetical protein